MNASQSNGAIHDGFIWKPGFITGVGDVPGGPSPANSATPLSRVFQISTGSAAVVPSSAKNPLLSHGLQLSKPAIELQPCDEDLPFMSQRSLIESPALLPDEELLGHEEEIAAFSEEHYYNGFQRLFAQYNDQSNRHASSQHARNEEVVRQRISSRRNSRRANPIFFSSRESASPTPTPSTGTCDRSNTCDRLTVGSTSELDPVDDENEKSRCTCPISYECNHRSTHKLDCRPLVREWQYWDDRKDQEAFDQQRIAEAFGDREATNETLVKIIVILDSFKATVTPRQAEGVRAKIRDWVLSMEDATVPQDAQAAIQTQVLPRLQSFLSDKNQELRRRGALGIHIEEELHVLMNKWSRNDFDGSIRRGLLESTTKDVNGFAIRRKFVLDPDWLHARSGLAFGNNGLVNGQIWLSRLELMRDGVHAPPVAGISGKSAKGAYSIVLGTFDEKKNEGYADIDMGNTIEYVGTALPPQQESSNETPHLDESTNIQDPDMRMPDAWELHPGSQRKPTFATQAMMKSLETGKPVRVIRSWKMCDMVKAEPARGYRYDGLYRVEGKTALKPSRQIWSFQLKRLPDQGPLRGLLPHEQPQDLNGGRRKGHSFYGPPPSRLV